MKKIVSLLMMVMVLLTLVSGTTVFAAEYDLSTLTDGKLNANLFSARNEMSYTSGGLPMNFKAEGSWLEFTVVAPEDGLYDVSARFGGYSCTGTYGFSVDGGSVMRVSIAHYGSSAKDFSIAPVYLTKGTHTVKIECLERPDNETNIVPIYRLIFTLNNGDEISSQPLGYVSACDTIKPEGAANLSFQPTHWAEYDIGVNETAWYKVYVTIATNAQWGLNVTANEGLAYETSADKICDKTGGYADKQQFELGKIRLFEGTNKVKVTNNRGTAVYFSGLTLVKLATDLETGAETEIAAPSYTSAHSNLGIGTDLIKYDISNENGKLSFQLNDSAEYDVIAPEEGEYQLKIKVGAPDAMAVNILVNDTDSYNVSLDATGKYTTLVAYDAAKITLKAGRNTIKVTNTLSGCYFNSISLKQIVPELTAFSTVSAMEYNLGGQNISYYDTTLIGGIETINEDTAIELTDTEWFKYDVEAQAAGIYGIRLSIAADDTETKTIKVTVNDGEAIELTATGTGASGASDFVLTDMKALNLSKGTNTLKIESVSGTWYMDSFSLYQPEIKFTGADGAVTAVPDGTLSASVMFGGLMIDETVDYYLAVYEVSASGTTKLIGVDMGSATVDKNTVAEMKVENITKAANCTYTAKVFVWNNMAGAAYLIG